MATFRGFNEKKTGYKQGCAHVMLCACNMRSAAPYGPCAPGDGTFPIVFGYISYQIRILLYLDVSLVYLECILMCPVDIHQDTCILFECNRACKIHLRYIRMRQDTCILPGYIRIRIRIRIQQDTYLIGNVPKHNRKCTLSPCAPPPPAISPRLGIPIARSGTVGRSVEKQKESRSRAWLAWTR